MSELEDLATRYAFKLMNPKNIELIVDILASVS